MVTKISNNVLAIWLRDEYNLFLEHIALGYACRLCTYFLQEIQHLPLNRLTELYNTVSAFMPDEVWRKLIIGDSVSKEDVSN